MRYGGEALYNPPPSLYVPRNLCWRFSQMYMNFPESARHEESGTPLEPGASVPGILQDPLLDGTRDQPTGTNQGDRHDSSTNDATRDLHQPWPSWRQYGLYPQRNLPTIPTFGFDDQDPSARSTATSPAPYHFRTFSDDTQDGYLDGGLREGSPISFADLDWGSILPMDDCPSSVVSVGTGSNSSGLWCRDAEHSTGIDPRIVGPPRSRQSQSPFRQDVQQRMKSPTPPWRCDMPLCRDRSFYWQCELLRHQVTCHHRQMPLDSSARHGRFWTPPKNASSSPNPSRNLVSFEHRGQPTATSERERHNSSANAASPQRPTRSSPIHQLNPTCTPRAKFAPAPVTQRRDPTSLALTHDETWSMWSYSRTAKPMPLDGAPAESPLAGNRQPGVKTHSDQAMSPLFPEFKLQPRRFFKVGRVFSVSRTKGTGENSTATSQVLGAAVVNFGERVFSKVRRFVVIRESDNYCNALAITTHSGRGVAGHGVIKSEHGIVYTGRTAPSARWDEHPRPGESGMRPIPIRVSPDSSSEQLDPMSRIHYGRTIRIEHDTMVRSYGQVSKQSMPDLFGAFRKVWSLDDAIDAVDDDDEDWILLYKTDGENEPGDGNDGESRISNDEDDDEGDGRMRGPGNDNDDDDGDGRMRHPGEMSDPGIASF